MIDSHTHLPTQQNHLQIVCSASLHDWNEVIELSNTNHHCIPFIGIHPWSINSDYSTHLPLLEEFLKKSPNLHIGETGFDAYKNKRNTELALQSFVRHLKLAQKYQRAVTIHSVKGWGVLIPTMKQFPELLFILHAFRGSKEEVKELMKLNTLFSFGERELEGISDKQKNAIVSIPPNKIVVESDGTQDIYRAVELLSTIFNDDMTDIISNNSQKLFRYLLQ